MWNIIVPNCDPVVFHTFTLDNFERIKIISLPIGKLSSLILW